MWRLTLGYNNAGVTCSSNYTKKIGAEACHVLQWRICFLKPSHWNGTGKITLCNMPSNYTKKIGTEA